MLLSVSVFILIALFALVSGFNDGGSIIASFLVSGVLPARLIVPLLIISVGLGPLVFGTAVSHTIAVEIVDFHRMGLQLLCTALFASLLTLLITWRLKIPTSTTIALVGGAVGSALAHYGISSIHWIGVVKVFTGFIGSVFVGFIVAYLLTKVLWILFSRMSMTWMRRLRYGQYVTAFFQGLAYGANDQEKAIGLMAVAIALVFHTTGYHVSFIAILFPLIFWSIGLVVGGSRIARTLGEGVVKLGPINALSAQTSVALSVSAASVFGLVVSTTQTTNGSLFGMGTARNPYAVNWATSIKIVKIWALTLPLALIVGWLSTDLLLFM
ncbi:MAG: inorganic phosphate transporter [Acidibacillus sp.]|nr:inorganic phosphate transporter [Acidibacillus sp.]